MKQRIFLLIILLTLASSLSYALVVVNSLDGRDVVSGIYYAAVANDDVVFVRPVYNEQALYVKIGTNKNILLIQSSARPVIAGMQTELRNRGNSIEFVQSTDPYATNLALADKSGARRFILVDPVYGYNTVSPLAYAKLNSMYLLFIDKSNAARVASFLKSKGADSVMLYGYVSAESKKALDDSGIKYSEINNGDKYDDNMQLLDMYFKQNPSKKQVVVSDGNAFEDTIAKGDDPVMLVSQVITPHVYTYVKQKAVEGQVRVLLVVDSDYVQPIYNMKTSINSELRSTVLHAFAKIGESTTAAGGQMGPVELFPLPGPILGLSITKVEYNTHSKALEVTYENTGNGIEYVKSQIKVLVDGSIYTTVGDDDFFPLASGERKGRTYPVNIESGDITANITALYGSSRRAAEAGIAGQFPAGRVQYTDDSQLEISDFTYDSGTRDLYVTFTNNGKLPLYFRPDAVTTVNGTSAKITSDTVYSLEQGKAQIVKFPGIVKGSSTIVAGANFGAREAFMQKRVEKEYKPPAEGFALDTNTLLLIVIMLLVLIIGYLAWERMRSGKQQQAQHPARKK